MSGEIRAHSGDPNAQGGRDAELRWGCAAIAATRPAGAAGAGYRPSVPIVAAQFADADTRNGWIRDKHMKVLQFWSDAHRETPIDMFVAEPFPFDEEYEHALLKPLHGSIDVRFVSIPALIRMKELAGRPQDLIDIENLKMISGHDPAR